MKDKILQLLVRNGGTCLSGQEISDLLGISRTAVWKHIKTLQEQGYPIESINRKGYLIKEGESLILSGDLKERLYTERLGKNILVLPRIDSTNQHARNIKEQLLDGDIIIAEEQTKGKGRRGKSWSSPRGEGIWITIYLEPTFSVEKAAFITQLAAAAMWHSIKKNTSIEAEIKWPNDLLVNGRKMCGILTELAGEINQIEFMLVGVGLNVNTDSFPEDINNIATSLKIVSGKSVNRSDLIIDFIQQFEFYYDELIQNDSSENALRIIRQNSSVIGRSINILKAGKQIQAKGINILDNGNLEVEYPDKSREVLSGGEVSVRNRDDE
ncbi:MAG: biotin--[acetyl-CoA-carboxylase] ligase [Tindallia sp. MSAO_Bac2]|nr:MAG: biotin--[acetyl-CoA-carboxylase] ligase [Tindallia sp. MSAO_Bac2]